MGNVAFSNVIQLETQSSKSYRDGAKNVETIPLTYMFGQRNQRVEIRAMSKYNMGDYLQAFHWQVTVD